MRRVPGELTTTAGGGPEMLAVEAMWNAVGVLVTATTEAPEGSTGDGATAANGVTAAVANGRRRSSADGADGSGEDERGDGRNAERGSAHDPRCAAPHCRERGPSPYVHSTVLGSRWLVNQVTIPTR